MSARSMLIMISAMKSWSSWINFRLREDWPKQRTELLSPLFLAAAAALPGSAKL